MGKMKQTLSRYGIKCVLVGDGGVGKTCLIMTYGMNAFPKDYVPTGVGNYSMSMNVGDKNLHVGLWDTAGQEDYKNITKFLYPQTDVFVLCFSLVNPTSFCNISAKWVPELKSSYPNATIILAGTKLDLRDDADVIAVLKAFRQKPITAHEGKRKADEIGAVQYMECSALTSKGVKALFNEAIRCALRPKVTKRKCQIL